MPFILHGLATQPVSCNVPEGQSSNAKVLTIPQINWNLLSDTYIIDPSQSNQLLDFQNIQGVYYLSTSLGMPGSQLVVSGTNHTIRFYPGSQGFYPLLCSDRPIFTVSYLGQNIGDGSLQLWFVNFPVAPFMNVVQ